MIQAPVLTPKGTRCLRISDHHPGHPRRGHGLATVAIPHVEVHGTGAGRRRLLGRQGDLRG